MVCLAEPRSKLENDEQDQVDNVRPFPAISVRGDTEENSTNRSEHEHKSDTPRDTCSRHLESVGQLRDGKRDGEEIKGIPSPASERAAEEEPLHGVKLTEKREWVW